jgi:hypothetical protein
MESMRKPGFLILALLLLLAITSAMPVHKFYVSKTTIELNPRTGSFEIICKIFTDDLEKAIGSTEENPVRLGSDREAQDADKRIEEYLRQHLILKLNNLPVELRYEGKESETDLTYCYLEFFGAPDFATLEVTNTILFEHFAEQQNIVDFAAHSKTRTAVFLQQQPTHVFYR